MPDVIADPDKLRSFASVLVKASDQLEQVGRQLQRSLDATGWRDTERAKFEQDFKATLRNIQQFSGRMKSEYAPQLQRKAAALDQFRS